MSNELKTDVAATARMLAAAGLVEAFGHVSARLSGGGFLITPTSPLLDAVADTVITVDDADAVVDNPAHAAPLEIPLHAAIYRARPDVAAICRGHGAAMVAWGVTVEDPPLRHGLGAIAGVHRRSVSRSVTSLPLRHGLGAIAGVTIPVHPDVDLIASAEAGARAAATLGPHHGALLRANGGFAVGADLLEAATRLWFLEERARVALAAAPSTGAEIDWGHRLTHTGVELRRAKAWFAARFAASDPSK